MDPSVARTRSEPASPESLYVQARDAAIAGQHQDALRWLGEAERLFRSRGDQLSALRTQLGLINVLADLSRTAECIDVAGRLRHGLREIEPDVTEEDRALHSWISAATAENYGAALELAGRHTEAAVSLDLARQLYVDVGSELDHARVNASLAVQALSTGSPAAAEAGLVTARATFEASGDLWHAQRCLVFEAQALAAMGRYRRALSALRNVDLDEAMVSKIGPDALRGRVVQAEVHLRLNLIDEALSACADLTTEFARLEMRREVGVCQHLQARALLMQGRRSEATIGASESVEIFDALHLPVRAAQARITYGQSLEDANHGLAEIGRAIKVLSTTGESFAIAEAALAAADLLVEHLPSELSHRRSFLDQAQGAGCHQSPELAWREHWHRSQLAEDHASRAGLLENSLAALAELRADLETDRHQIPFMSRRRKPLESMLELCLENGDIAGAFELSSHYRAASLAEETSPLPPIVTQTTLLYQAIGDRLLCFVASPDAATGSKVDLLDLGECVQAIETLLMRLDGEWRHAADPLLRQHLGALQPVTDRLLRELHHRLLEIPLRHVPTGPILVVPVGKLASVPFAALHGGEDYVVADRPISITPRLATHGAVQQRESASSQRLKTLSVGVPDERAPLVGAEARKIAEVTNGHLLLGRDASAARVRSALEDADVVHLAGHSTFHSANPWLSAFDFADGSLTAAELSDWDLRGKTVVFASCSSARQNSLGEDELLGLPRAAVRAGARHVLVNLWEIDDASSVAQMVDVHRNLCSLAPGEALRRAQVAARDRNPHPFYWASMVHYTNSSQRPLGPHRPRVLAEERLALP